MMPVVGEEPRRHEGAKAADRDSEVVRRAEGVAAHDRGREEVRVDTMMEGVAGAARLA
jgi:hypothetical protein